MRVSRRQLLGLFMAFGAVARWLPAWAGKATIKPSLQATLRVWLDTLIPADSTPSATQLGVDRLLLDEVLQNPGYRKLLIKGLAWLDTQAQQQQAANFLALDQAGRDTVVKIAAAADPGSHERLFFELTRHDAFSWYYSQPASWDGIPGFHGPPQPLGYPDYRRPPVRKP